MSPTWMFRTKEAEAERQATQRARRQDRGCCIRCGLAFDSRSRQLCSRHLIEQRLKQRERFRAAHPKAPRRLIIEDGRKLAARDAP